MRISLFRILFIGISFSMLATATWYGFLHFEQPCGIEKGRYSSFDENQSGDCTCAGIKWRPKNPNFGQGETDARCFGLVSDRSVYSKTYDFRLFTNIPSTITVSAPGIPDQVVENATNHRFYLPISYTFRDGKRFFDGNSTVHVKVASFGYQPFEEDVPLNTDPEKDGDIFKANLITGHNHTTNLTPLSRSCKNWNDTPIADRARNLTLPAESTSWNSHYYKFSFQYPTCWKLSDFIATEFIEAAFMTPTPDCPEDDNGTWEISYSGPNVPMTVKPVHIPQPEEGSQFHISTKISGRTIFFYEKFDSSEVKPFNHQWLASFNCANTKITPRYSDYLDETCLKKAAKTHYVPDIFLKFILGFKC